MEIKSTELRVFIFGNKQNFYVTNPNVVNAIMYLIYLEIYTKKSLTFIRRGCWKLHVPLWYYCRLVQYIVTRSRFWLNSIEKMTIYSKYSRLSQLSLKYDNL